MYKLLQEINPVLFGKNEEPSIDKSGRLVGEPPIDNFVFRLHYRATTAGLIAASILVNISNSFETFIKSSLQTSSYHYLDSSGSAIQCMVGKRYSKIVTQVAIRDIRKTNVTIFLSYLALLGVKHLQFARFVGHRHVPWCWRRLWL